VNIFPKFRDEHSKNIWVATTLFRILLTPSPGKKVLCRGSLSMGIIKGQWWLIIPLLRPYLLGRVALKGGGAPEIPMFQESSHSHGRPVGFQDIFVGWPEVCALCMNAYIYIYSESTLHPVTVASKSFFCMQGFHSKHVSKSWWSLASCVGGRPNINIYIYNICIYTYIYTSIYTQLIRNKDPGPNNSWGKIGKKQIWEYPQLQRMLKPLRLFHQFIPPRCPWKTWDAPVTAFGWRWSESPRSSWMREPIGTQETHGDGLMGSEAC